MPPSPQWGGFHLHDIEAVEEVLAELALLDRCLQVDVGGGQNSHIDGDFLVGTHRANAPFFKGAQDLGL